MIRRCLLLLTRERARVEPFGSGGFLSWLDDLEGSDLLADDQFAAAEV
jgi:hypothetical protein